MGDANQPAPKQPTPPLEYARRMPGERTGRARRAILIVSVGLLCCVLIPALILPQCCRSREPSKRIECASNLKQIGLGIAMYANDHGGQFPDTFMTEFENEDLTPAVFVCPSSNDLPAAGPTTQATVANLLVPGHLSYVYLGKGLNDKTALPDMVLAYEPLSNHNNYGMNALFGDLRVEWLSAAEAQPLLNQVASQTWPVRIPPATQPVNTGAGN